MFRKKQSDKQSPQVKEPQQKEQNPKQKQRRNRRIFRLVVLVLLVCFGWAGYNNLKNKSMPQLPKKSDDSLAIQSAKSIPVNPNNMLIVNEKQLTGLEKSETIVASKSTVVPMPKVVLPTYVHPTKTPDVPPIPKDLSQPTETKSKEPTNIISNTKENTKSDENLTPSIQELEEQIEVALADNPTSDYSLRDALIFRDHFLSEQPCGDDFRKLILSDDKTPITQEVIKSTSYFCLTTNNVYGELNGAFISAKKQALIQSFYQNNSKWKARILSFLSRLVQVRNLNPKGDTPSDLLDKAHKALDNKNIALTVEIISDLPPYMQSEFQNFLEKSKNYADAANALENLILSYAKGE